LSREFARLRTFFRAAVVLQRDVRALEPSADTRFEAGDVVVLLGVPAALAVAEGRLLKG
jgi:hypothetical protein